MTGSNPTTLHEQIHNIQGRESGDSLDHFRLSLVLKSSAARIQCMVTEVKKRTQRRRVPVKDRKEQSGRIAAHRPAALLASSTLLRPERLGEESEAEMMVTRICDSILDRLKGTEAPDGEAKAQRPRRRTH